MKTWLLILSILLIASEAMTQNCNGPNLIEEVLSIEGSTFGTSIGITQQGSPYVVGHDLLTSPPPDDGQYSIGRNTSSWGSFAEGFWNDVEGLSGGGFGFSNDYFLVVNANYGAQAFLRYDLELCPSTEYNISFDAINMFKPGITTARNDANVNVAIVLPHFGVYVTGAEVLDLGTVAQNAQWQAFEGRFITPPTGANLSVEIWQTNPGFISVSDPGNKDFGRDFAIDNIVIKECGFIPSVIDTTICEGQIYNLNGQFLTETGQYADTGIDNNGCEFNTTVNLTVARRDETLVPIQLCEGDSYEGQTYAESTNLPSQNLTNMAGCDSIIVVQIEVFPKYDLQATASICRGESVEGIAIFQDTTFILIEQTINGCDSLTTYDVSIQQAIETNEIVEICTGQTYILGTQTISTSGNYSETLQASNNCDSISNVQLVVIPSLTLNVDERICAGESYSFAGQSLTEAGTYTDTQSSITGCDSTTILSLIIAEPTTGIRQILLCEGASYQGIAYTEDATLTEMLTNEAGCDSLLTTQILVSELYDEMFTPSVCSGESVQGIPVFQDTTIIFQNTSIEGCDSISTYQVRVNEAVENSFTQQICSGESYTLGSQILTTAGTYSELFMTSLGCDSLVLVDLTILNAINVPLNASICSGESYDFSGQMLTAGGTYTDTQTTSTGCDSTTTLTLIVGESSTGAETVNLCSGESYEGQVYTEDATLTEMLTNEAGCDSLLTTQILVSELYDEMFTPNVCAGESVQGIPVFQDTTIIFQNTSIAGCDSISTYQVRVNEAVENSFAQQICSGESYTLGNQTLITAGTYSELFMTSMGCDSLVTVDLSILNSINVSLNESICSGESYDFLGQMLTESGTYTDTQTTSTGCDSTTTLTLVVGQSSTGAEAVNLCSGDSYDGQVYTEDATLTEMLTNEAGCDSLLTTQILVSELYDEMFTPIVCAGESVQGIPVFQDTTIIFQNTSIAGCDSISTYQVTVSEAVENSFAWEICSGESYVLGSQTLTEAGTYSESLMTSTGCDSLVTVDLSVLNSINVPLEASICEGESYDFSGQTLTESGTYTDTQTTSTGCDSTTTLTLIVGESSTGAETVNLCSGESYDGQVYTEDATLTEMLTNEAGCDSLLTTQILVSELYDEIFSSSVCAGQSVQGISVFQDTTIIFQNTSIAGCDSISTYEVTVSEAIENSFAWEICSGESYVLGSQTLTEAGTYSESLMTSTGCDSLVTVDLSVLNSINVPLNAIICEGESYDFAGQTLTTGGTYTDTQTTSTGCDSTTTLTLVVGQSSTGVETVNLCSGDSYEGQVYTEDATITEMLTNEAGCDSLLTTQILVSEFYDEMFTPSVCSGESVQGILVFQDTTIIFQNTSITGCDSISTYQVTVNEAIENSFAWEICSGESYVLGSQTLTEAGTYSELFTTSTGCDSLVTVDLSVLNSINVPLNASICEGENYDFSGQTLTEAGTYTDTQTTSTGCDSTTTLTLAVGQSSTGAETVNLCSGESYEGQVYTEDATLTEMLTNETGCDSLLTTQILVSEIYDEIFSPSVCGGESVQGIPVFQDTTIIFQNISIAGCDSISTYEVTVSEAIENSFAWEICSGESYVLGSQTLTEAGIYSELFTTSTGCDSLVTVDLSVLNSINVPLNAIICEGKSYDFAGQTLTTGGTYTDTQTTSTGCDSTTTLTLVVAETSAETIDINLCAGESYQGIVYTENRTLVEALTNTVGCDSILTIQVFVTPIYEESEIVQLCEGELFEGTSINGDTLIIRAMQSVMGCDSTTTYDIRLERIENLHITGDLNLCSGSTGQLSVGDFASYNWSTGATTASIDINSIGTYAVTVTSAGACEAEATVDVTASELQATIEGTDPSCFGQQDGTLTVDVAFGTPPYSFSLDGGSPQSTAEFTNLAAGDHEVFISDAAGCTLSLFLPLIKPAEFRITLRKDTTVNIGTQLDLSVTSNMPIETYLWETTAPLSCLFCPNPVVDVNAATSVELSVANADGCIAKASVQIGVNAFEVFQPTSFSPNEDGINDRFMLGLSSDATLVHSFQIFDRWGNLIHAVENAPTTAPELAWNGYFRNDEMDEGVYIWTAAIEFIDGSIRKFNGELILLR